MRQSHIIAAGAAVVLSFLTACGSSSTTPVTRTSAAGVTPAAPGAIAARGTAPLTISIAVPRGTSSAQRSAQYVSPNTQSMMVTTAPDNVSGVNVASCTSTCTMTLGVPVTTTSISVYLYGNPNAQGTPTSQSIGIPVTITANASNTVTLTFDGIMDHFVVSASPASVVEGFPNTIAVTAHAVDNTGAFIMPPGNVFDVNGYEVIGANGTPFDFFLTTSDVTNLPVGAATFNPVDSTISATASFTGLAAAPFTISPDSGGARMSTIAGFTVAVLEPLSITTPLTTIGVLPPTDLTTQAYTLEIPTQNATPVTLSVTANYTSPAVTGFTLGADSCSGSDVDALLAGAFPATPSLNAYQFSFNTLASPQSTSCTFDISDNNGKVVHVNLVFDSSTLIVQGRRKTR